MRDITADEIFDISGGLMMAEGHRYERCVAGYTLGGGLFGAAIGVGTTWGIGGVAGFGVGATLGGIAGAYFCG